MQSLASRKILRWYLDGTLAACPHTEQDCCSGKQSACRCAEAKKQPLRRPLNSTSTHELPAKHSAAHLLCQVRPIHPDHELARLAAVFALQRYLSVAVHSSRGNRNSQNTSTPPPPAVLTDAALVCSRDLSTSPTGESVDWSSGTGAGSTRPTLSETSPSANSGWASGAGAAASASAAARASALAPSSRSAKEVSAGQLLVRDQEESSRVNQATDR